MNSTNLPLWCLHRNVVGEFASFRDPEGYAGGSVATGRVSQAGQVKRVEARRREIPWPSRLGVGHKASNLVPEKIKTAKNAQLLKTGQMNNRRPERVLRNKKDNIYLGTWNVRTMLQPGKMQEVAEQILQTEVQIVALQEIR